MLASQVPPKFPIPFGAGAGPGFIRSIPVASQIGINPGFASLTDGFVPVNFSPVAAGGIPPFGADANGILHQITQWNQWQSAGGPIFYDAAFAASIGGYPKFSVLNSAVVFGNYWISQVDNNLTDPDSSSAAFWISPPGLAGTGALGYTVFSALPPSWVWAKNNYTIGNAGSAATHAAGDAAFLYAALWNGFPNSQCPVTGGRGANPAADFAAGKPIQVLDLGGMGIVGQDNLTGRLSGVPVTSGNPNAPGCVLGENFHALTSAQIPGHTHNGGGTTGLENAAHAHTGSGTTSGQSTDHNHTGGGTTGSDSPDHAHTALQVSGGPAIIAGGGSFPASTQNTSGATARHAHAYSFTTSGVNVDHSHTYAFTTAAENANHAHGYSFVTDVGTGGNGSHNTVQLGMTVNWMLKL
jgi:hypothetical protein